VQLSETVGDNFGDSLLNSVKGHCPMKEIMD
jgi:hypothetical protein